jgi:hypothetical protein
MDATEAPLLPKLRGQFAEFLNRGSLVHLKGLALRLPVSVCGTGCAALGGVTSPVRSGFSGRPGHPSTSAASRRLAARLGVLWEPDLPGSPPLRADRSSPQRPAAGPYRVPAFASRLRKCRTVHLLSIAYAGRKVTSLGLGPD